MAISDRVAAIRTAVYGKDVREAIAGGIEECYSDVTNGVTLANTAAAKLEGLTAEAHQGATTSVTVTENTSTGAKHLNFTLEIGPQGPKGDTGDKGDKGDTGDTGPVPVFSIGTVNYGTNAAATINASNPAYPKLNLTLPKGDKGDKGDTGLTGERGITPTFHIGSVTSGDTASATVNSSTPEHPTLSLVLPRGAQGPQGPKGDKGDPGTISNVTGQSINIATNDDTSIKDYIDNATYGIDTDTSQRLETLESHEPFSVTQAVNKSTSTYTITDERFSENSVLIGYQYYDNQYTPYGNDRFSNLQAVSGNGTCTLTISASDVHDNGGYLLLTFVWMESDNVNAYKFYNDIAVNNNDPTLAWGEQAVIGTINGDPLSVHMPAEPEVSVSVPATVPTLGWNTSSTIGTVNGNDFKVKLPANPASSVDSKIAAVYPSANILQAGNFRMISYDDSAGSHAQLTCYPTENYNSTSYMALNLCTNGTVTFVYVDGSGNVTQRTL